MPHADDIFREAFEMPVNFTGLEPYEVKCPRGCGTRLKTYYCEGGLYAVKCCYCETITLLKAPSALKAAEYTACSNTEEKYKSNGYWWDR